MLAGIPVMFGHVTSTLQKVFFHEEGLSHNW